ncbi:efflux RND transporter periplasmic adaptor subunit [Clostridium brassicae]|uniref:Efflux RND transporter periplasmic adaptor subunit n=1 Tax=Clostridium brassicae TaxID=2999072 RepID=A0ABT4DAP0_9CLOT|nr:efflux RND transporter periplasmic adaptor subunit [Clostridium brassicae]MCY6959377.1 efflux RND transporter periplasmic adaptor subunit [Clostridium brassicae]
MKRLISLLVTSAVMFSMTGCGKKVQAGEEKKVLPVKVMDVKEEKHPILLEYLGNTNSKDIIKYSFKIPGKIAEINVKEGDYVKAGQVIAVLDSHDYNFAVDAARGQAEAARGQTEAARGQMEAAKGQMEAAKGQIAMADAQVAATKALYNKAMNGAQKEDINSARLAVKNAEDTYKYVQQSYERIKKLYDEGIVSKQQLDDIKIKLDSSKVALDNAKEVLSKAENGARVEDKEAALAQHNAAKAQRDAAKSKYSAAQGQYNAAQGQYNAAQGQCNAANTQYESKQSMLDDTVLKSEVSGYVAKVLNKSGENTAAGYPVIAVRSDDQVIDIQIAQNDVGKVKEGTKANLSLEEIKTTGTITEIEQVPDAKSRTYKAKIKMDKEIEKEKFYVGSVAKVDIKLGDKTGIWLPITVVLNDGEDYVYVVEKGRVSRKNITIESIYGDKILVKGVKLGDKIVTQGLKNVKPGNQVNIVK